jgi:hypothetical protein|tara:strand:+ start:1614 stop:1751 length:138 start_codon:yes stop_codon:yes gene_type:complete
MHNPAVMAREHKPKHNDTRPGFVGVVISNIPYQRPKTVDTAMKNR